MPDDSTTSVQVIKAEHAVLDAFLDNDRIIVLYDPDSVGNTLSGFENLVAFSLEGRLLWKAELPNTANGDRYYHLSSKDPIIAESIFSHSCIIDGETGRILSSTFYK